MKYFSIQKVEHRNAGIAREWALCKYFGIERVAHDSSSYDKSSDLIVDNMNISIKASAFTLMSGTLCEGRTTFDEIWKLYESRVHSDHFAYITADFDVYMMNKDEFKTFVYEFCTTERESSKNGGAMKIRCRKETKKC